MTPTASRLQVRLEDRMLWFRNQWLFKWHHIKGQRPVSIDTFDGRQATYSGIGFEGSPRDVYWSTITRGARLEVENLFTWVEENVRSYPQVTAEAAIDECAPMIASFIVALRRHVVDKDRILRGNGIEFPPHQDAGDWRGLSHEEIVHRATDLKRALFPPKVTMMTTKQRSEQFIRALYSKTGPDRLRHVMFQEIGKELGWSKDQLRSAADYAVQTGLAEWAAMGGWISITRYGIDHAEDAIASDGDSIAAPRDIDGSLRLESPIAITGTVTNSIIQIAGNDARQSVVASPDAIAALKEFGTLFRPVLDGINEHTTEVATLKAHVASLEAQIASPAPRRSILLEIAKGIAESVASDAIKHVIVAAMPSAPALLQQIIRLLAP